MPRHLATAIVRMSALLAPRRLRAAWREEWLAEISAARGTSGRMTTTSPDLAVRNGWTADFRDAWRALVKTPLQTITMIGCLSVGAALMVTIFAIANALSAGDPAGVRDREQLVRIGARLRTSHLYTLLMSDYRRADWQRPPDAFEAIGGEYSTGFMPVVIHGDVHQARGLRVTGTYFPLLGSVPAIGRLIGPSDDVPGAAPVVVLGHRFWQRRFGGDPSVLGRVLPIGAGTYEIVGVAPPGFVGFEMGDLGQSADADRDFWLPMAPILATRPEDSAAPDLVGRLAPGVTLQQAEAQLQAFLPDPLVVPASQTGRLGVLVYRLAPLENTRDFALFFILLFSVPAVILLIACANVAGLQAVRAVQRRHELALRTSLGATRARLARLLTIETLIVAAAAAAAGWGASVVALRQSAAFLPFAAQLDWRVFLFALGLPLAVTLMVGVIPSWRSTRFDVLSGLRLGARAGGPGRTRVRRALIATQVALSIALVFTAIVLSRALAKGPPGMIPGASDIVTAGFYLTSRADDEGGQRAAVQRLVEEASQLAAPRNIAFSTGPLLVSGRAAMTPPGTKARFQDWFDTRVATPAFFDLFGVTLLEGRFYDDREQGVMVVNESFARRFSDGEAIVGKSYAFAADGLFGSPSEQGHVTRQVIGLVKDGFERDANDRQAALAYLPLDTARLTSVAVFVRSPNSAETLQGLRAMAARESPTLLPRPFGTVESLMSEEYRSAIWLSRALGGTGMLALLLAAVGLFELVSASVTQRTHELGVRVALGARGADIIGLIMRDISLMSGVGVVAGIALAVPAWVFIQDEVMKNATLADPAGLLAGLAALGVTMFAATYAPARRACGADPLNALRSE
ncbi:MAG: ABC transporter permease [Vicinamibacterales bacterium]